MTTTTKERKKTGEKQIIPPWLMPHGSKKTVKVELKPSKVKTSMRERALLFYQSCFISTRNILKSLISSI